MLRTRLLLWSVSLAAAWSFTAARAQEEPARETRARAEAMAREVEPLRAEGDPEEADRLAGEIDGLREEAERAAPADAGEPGSAETLQNRIRALTEQWADAIAEHRQDARERLEREIHELARETGARIGPLLRAQVDALERRVAELREQGQGERAEQLAERMREMVQAHRRAMAEMMRPRQAEPLRGPDMARRAEQERRLHHLRVAADHLDAAGMTDVAERLRGEAAEIERHLPQPPPPPQGPPQPQLERLQQQVRGLHERLDVLQHGMDELLELARRRQTEE